MIGLLLYLVWCGALVAEEPPPLGASPTDFAAHVRIDWSRREVQVDTRVVLRAGPLELLVCTVNTREHESILVTQALASHIYQALGLLGAEPGAPPRWDADREVVIPAHGSLVEVDVLCEGANTSQREPAHRWLKDMNLQRSVAPLRWVFCGSMPSSEGGLAADVDGTIITLVDFDSALLSLPASHSADNAWLWVEPDTPRVPPSGTPCTLLLRPVSSTSLLVELGRFGTIQYDGRAVDFDVLEAQLAAGSRDGRWGDLELRVEAWALPSDVRRFRAALRRAGIEDEVLEAQLGRTHAISVWDLLDRATGLRCGDQFKQQAWPVQLPGVVSQVGAQIHKWCDRAHLGRSPMRGDNNR